MIKYCPISRWLDVQHNITMVFLCFLNPGEIVSAIFAWGNTFFFFEGGRKVRSASEADHVADLRERVSVFFQQFN